MSLNPVSLLSRVWSGFRRALRVISRPVRRDRGLKGVVIQPYRGYGTSEEVFLMGRIFRQFTFGAELPPGSVVRELSDVLRRLTRWGLSEVSVVARFGGAEKRVTTDDDGYFRLTIAPAEPVEGSDAWHTVELEASRDGETATEEGFVFIPPPSARRVVISDIDDTVMVTGVAEKAKMLWRLFIQGPESRTAFPGVAPLYRGFHRGTSEEDEGNPMLYVSRAPWSIYEVLEAFFRLKKIPEGPILFLREWGLTLQSPLPRRAVDHKRDLITDMLARYDELPFILIGDSGQHDPEAYAEIVHEYPGRVEAVYIRDVDRDEARQGEIEALGREIAEAGSDLVLASDSTRMAEHAARAGFIRPEVVDEVRGKRRDVEGE